MQPPYEKLNASQVKELQQALGSLGTGVQADGILGPATRTARGRFKASIGADEPDTIGPASAKALQEQLNAHGAEGDGTTVQSRRST